MYRPTRICEGRRLAPEPLNAIRPRLLLKRVNHKLGKLVDPAAGDLHWAVASGGLCAFLVQDVQGLSWGDACKLR